MKIIRKLKDYKFEPSERYFLFTDGSLREQHKSDPLMGLGASIRNKEGKKILFYSEAIRVNQLPVFADKYKCEEMALLNAINICKHQGIKLLFINSDNSGMVQTINNYLNAKKLKHTKQQEKLFNQKNIYSKIFSVINDFEDVLVEHIFREENKEADFYSKYAKDLESKNILDENLEKKPSHSQTVAKMIFKMKQDIDKKHMQKIHKGNISSI